MRTVANWLNLSTPLGLAVAWLGGATITRHGRGTWLCTGYRFRFPAASAFTIGSVITSHHGPAHLQGRPRLLQHEDRHCTQYAFCLGPVMLPLYGAAAVVSYLVAGDHWTGNPFERLAGLADGDYVPGRLRWRRRR